MANGVEISNVWKAWLASDAGKQASDPNSLGTTLSARNYLENRLHNAFMAGAEVAQGCGVGEEPFYNAETGQVEDEAGYKSWLDSKDTVGKKQLLAFMESRGWDGAISILKRDFFVAAETSQSEEVFADRSFHD